MNYPNWAAAIVVAISTPSAAAPADEEAAGQAAAAHSSSIEAIHTLYSKVELRVSPGPKLAAMMKKEPGPTAVYRGEFWKAPGLVRVRQLGELGSKGQSIEYLRTNGRTRSVRQIPGKEPNTVAVGLLVAGEWKRVVAIDAWKCALFVLPLMDSEEVAPISLKDAVLQMKVQRVSKDKGPKGELTRIALDGGKLGIYTVWLDPAVNWLARKIVREIPAGAEEVNGQKSPARRNEYEVTDFTEVRPAIYFPTGVAFKGYVNDELTVTHDVLFTSVKANELSAPPFPLSLPTADGMAVIDEISGTTYKSDAEGNPAGTQSALRYAPAPDTPARPDPTSLPNGSVWARPGTWLFALSGLLALAAGYVYYRRRRAAN